MELFNNPYPDPRHFGPDFKWGVSVSAYQIEGAHDKDGKGFSIWDVYTNSRGRTRKNQNANVACDFYNRYAQDLYTLKEMGIPNFRFSISWPRLLPNGTGAVNQKGVDFYKRVIDLSLNMGIEPWVTLYHWDLPYALEKKGGWTNRDVLGWFEEFVTLCAKEYGDKVKHWMVLNEPMVFTGAGYFLGVHAPGRRGLRNFLPAVHHAALSIGVGGRVLRQLCPQAEVGSTFSCSYVEPYRDHKEKDLVAAKRADALLNRLFIEPVLGMGYPIEDIPSLRYLNDYIKADDEKNLKFDLDFTGIQIYTRELVEHSWFTPYIRARLVPAEKRRVKTTLMGWEVYPESIYQMIRKFGSYKNIKKIIVTENGAAFHDVAEDGRVADRDRVNYLREHIDYVGKAREEGYPVEGYFVWTLQDNFEWAEGYFPRFGLIHVDFETQERIVKDSGRWFSHWVKHKES
jgi:beta-glucosidase